MMTHDSNNINKVQLHSTAPTPTKTTHKKPTQVEINQTKNTRTNNTVTATNNLITTEKNIATDNHIATEKNIATEHIIATEQIITTENIIVSNIDTQTSYKLPTTRKQKKKRQHDKSTDGPLLEGTTSQSDAQSASDMDI